jgi:hypothetical protein
MEAGFQIAAVPDSDQIGKFRHKRATREPTYRPIYKVEYVIKFAGFDSIFDINLQ